MKTLRDHGPTDHAWGWQAGAGDRDRMAEDQT